MAAELHSSDRRVIPSLIAQLQAEGRWLTFARLALAAAFLSWFGLLVWALPALAGATALDEASSAIVLTVVFCLSASASSAAAWVVWRPLLHGEARSELVRLVLGGRKLVRSRAQFEARLEYECRRPAEGNGFLVVLIRAAHEAVEGRRSQASATHPGLAALLVRSAAREDDVVAVDPPRDVWLLARGDADALRNSLVPRLTRILTDVDDAAPYQIGISEFDGDETAPAQLLDDAYKDLRDVVHAAERPAAESLRQP